MKINTQRTITLSLFLFSAFLTNFVIPADQSAQPYAMPSVKEVFSGKSPQEIADDVQQGQKILEDILANGSPEEVEAFMRMLEDTMNSMTDEDFADITAISEMVAPYIAPTVPAQDMPINTTPTTPTETPILTTSINDSSDVEKFKEFISSIIQRIDDIFQKIKSSKECSEEIEAKWSNKSTFQNMKRQIYQLKNDRLAKKLTNKDLAGDEKKLVVTLQEFLKDLTTQNNAIKIEDDFGLTTNLAVEKKYLKQTLAFRDLCNDYIDNIMPILEKFLTKYDPEALQLAKQADEQTKSAIKSANEASSRKSSVPSQPTSKSAASSRYNPTKSADYGNFNDNYGYGGYDDYGNYNSGSQTSASPDISSATSQALPSNTPSSAKKLEDGAAGKDSAKSPNKDDKSEDLLGDLEDHMKNTYSALHENKFVKFLQEDLINDYPEYTQVIDGGSKDSTAEDPNKQNNNLSTIAAGGTQGGTFETQEISWLNGTGQYSGTFGKRAGFATYVSNIETRLKREFLPEFDDLGATLKRIKDNMLDMSPENLKTLQNSSILNDVEARLKHYQQALANALPQLDKLQQENGTVPGAPEIGEGKPGGKPQRMSAATVIERYGLAHRSFIDKLKTSIDEEAQNLIAMISRIKNKAKRSTNKKK